ncbi:hypothetical protein KZ770_26660 [Escherichia coli]|nr:hypothetical protein [Escherichia coli]
MGSLYRGSGRHHRGDWGGSRRYIADITDGDERGGGAAASEVSRLFRSGLARGTFRAR